MDFFKPIPIFEVKYRSASNLMLLQHHTTDEESPVLFFDFIRPYYDCRVAVFTATVYHDRMN